MGAHDDRIVELDYSNLSAEEMASKIGLRASFMPKLISSFVAGSLKLTSALKLAIMLEDYSQIEQIAHSLRGSAANLRFSDLESLARDMEFAAKEQDREYDYERVSVVFEHAIESISLKD